MKFKIQFNRLACTLLIVFIGLFYMGGCDTGDSALSPDGDATDGDSQEDGDRPDGDSPDGDIPDGDIPDGDNVDGDESDGDQSDGDDSDGDEDCTCDEVNDCCDGCHPINENGECEDDGLPCTQEICQSGECVHLLHDDSCLIDGTCYEEGEGNPANDCEQCRPAWDQHAWLIAEDGKACDDGEATTANDSCRAGNCIGIKDGCECGGVDFCCDGCMIINENGPCTPDGSFCTADICVESFCTHEIKPGHCLIAGLCYEDGQANPQNECEQCMADANVDQWVASPDGQLCEDGNACSLGDTCQNGTCFSGDDLQCREPDQCHEEGQCLPDDGNCDYPPKPDGSQCDDGNADTSNDSCRAGTCLGEGCVCNRKDECCDGCNFTNEQGPCNGDGFHCTADLCISGTCTHASEEGWCLIGQTCLEAGERNPDNVCQICAPQTDDSSWSPIDAGTPCDDHNLCTGYDTCQNGYCVSGEVEGCVEPDQCHTAGECNPDTGDCGFLPVPDGQGCNDGNPDTTNDICVGGMCLGEGCVCGEVNDCCDGCNFRNSGSICDEDDLECTMDICRQGVCHHDFIPGWCFIEGICIVNGVINPTNTCLYCDAAALPNSWMPVEDGGQCDDFDLCSGPDICANGYCYSEQQLDCTTPPGPCQFSGECHPDFGSCEYENKPDGTSCHDDNHNIADGSCLNGLCVESGCVCNEQNECCDGCNSINNGDDCESDGLACTADICNGGQCTHALAAGWCRIAGECFGDGQLDPQNSCQLCDSGKSSESWTVLEDQSICDDDNSCTLIDQCYFGYCYGSGAIECPSDDPCRNSGICNPVDGSCMEGPPVEDGRWCTDGLFCNGDDHCIDGACLGHQYAAAPIPDACIDDNPCSLDTCEEGDFGFICGHEMLSDTQCDDGLYCNGDDYCDDGECMHQWENGIPPGCDDEDICFADSCEEGANDYHCIRTPLTGTPCDDNSACTLQDMCEEGECVGGMLRECISENPCMQGYCDHSDGECYYSELPIGTTCDDDDACTTGDTCDDGECVGDLTTCFDPPICHELPGQCNQSTGECEYGYSPQGIDCDDGNPQTTDDQCDGQGHCIGEGCVCDNSDPACCDDCQAINEGGTCDDGDGLTCTGGSCVSGFCESSLATGWCVIRGACVESGALNPFNRCESCQPGESTNAWTPRQAGSDCNDGLACNGSDTCTADAVCTHAWPNGLPPDCDDAESCTRDTCIENPTMGYTCNHQNLTGTSCDDSLGCNGQDTCMAGACSVHQWPDSMPPECDDDNVCTEDTCIEMSGDFECHYDGAANNGKSCTDDGLSCTSDTCDDGQCTHERMENHCLIMGACYNDGQSNPQNGCEYCDPFNSPQNWRAKQDGTSCEGDSLACTIDACDSGDCVHDEISDGYCLIGGSCYTNNTPNGQNECEYCDSSMDQTDWSWRPVGAPCNDDGNSCTSDTCDDGECLHDPVQQGTACEDDGNDCTSDICSADGICVHPVAENQCAIGGVCYDDDDLNPANECEYCDSDNSQTSWSPTPGGTNCDDGEWCTTDDECDGQGNCEGDDRDCSDGFSCTTDTCDETDEECEHEIDYDFCLIGGECYDDDDPNPTNECEYCDASSNTSWSDRDSSHQCNDGYFCTVSDHCDGSGGCTGDPNPCHESPDLECTTDTCDEAAGCIHTQDADTCLIDGVCYDENDENPQNDCEYCDPDQDDSDWTAKADGTSCDTGALWCKVNGQCSGGVCDGGEDRDCSDGLDCTTDTCDEEEDECVNTAISGWCAIDDDCWQNNTPNPENDCEYCSSSSDPYNWSNYRSGYSCDDDLYCTGSDTCDGAGTCVHQYPSGVPDDCDSGNICLEDGCIEDTDDYICTHDDSTNNGDPCDDNNLCTTADECRDGTCVGSPIVCDDHNTCTHDWCGLDDGLCNYRPLPFGTPCQADDDLCTRDICMQDGQDYVCVRGDEPDCNDGNVCTSDYCDSHTGLCINDPIEPDTCNNDSDCPDGMYCRDETCLCECDDNLCTLDICLQGRCAPGGAGYVTCDEPSNWPNDTQPSHLKDGEWEGDWCFDEFCDPRTGECTSQADHTQADGNAPVVCGNFEPEPMFCQDLPDGAHDGCCEVCDRLTDPPYDCVPPEVEDRSTCCIPNWIPDLPPDLYCCIWQYWEGDPRNPNDPPRWVFVANPQPGREACPDDGLACTSDYCDQNENPQGLGFCIHNILPTKCLIDNQCYDEGEDNPNNPCEFCLPSDPTGPTTPLDQVTWTVKREGTACEDPCSECTTAECAEWDDGKTHCETYFDPETACDDQNACTQDICDISGVECVVPHPDMRDYTPCDDQDPTTINDVCISGICSHGDLGTLPIAKGPVPIGPPDGRPDVITSDGEIFFWQGPGQNFQNAEMPYEMPIEFEHTDLSLADFNRDGFIDVAFSTESQAPSMVYWGPLYSQPAAPTILPTVEARYNCAGDINGDGYPDLVFACKSGNSLVYYYNPASPFSFNGPIELPVDDGMGFGCAILDMNSDGLMDVIIGKTYSSPRGAPLTYGMIYFRQVLARVSEFTTPYFFWTHNAKDISASQIDPLFEDDSLIDAGFPDLAVSYGMQPMSYVIFDAAPMSGRYGLVVDSYTDSDGIVTTGAYGNSMTDLNISLGIPRTIDSFFDVVLSANTDDRSSHSIAYSGYYDLPGPSFGVYAEPATATAQGNAVGDIDGDGHPDIVFINHSKPSEVYWGASFTSTPPTPLNTSQNDLKEVEVAGSYSHMGGVCTCHKINECCDGCKPYNNGHPCNIQGNKVCMNGYCEFHPGGGIGSGAP